MVYSVVIAGSTERTLTVARTLSEDPRFQIISVLTPSPKPIGRKQVLTKNPLQQWAEVNTIPVILVEKKLTQDLTPPTCDFLLVVDFGYIVPQWLLDIPTIAPINIHPSRLPNYRGSSPAQFALAFGEKESAVSVIVMDEKLDHGPIITTLPFTIDPAWTAADYYAHAFDLISRHIADILVGYAHNHHATSQPDISPTPTARMLTRDDGYVPYGTLQTLLHQEIPKEPIAFLEKFQRTTNTENLSNLWRGLTPWPGVWTLVDGKRMKLLEFHMEGEKLFLDTIQIEGEKPKQFTGR